MTQIEDFRLGDDGELYVIKRVPETTPVFSAILRANTEDRDAFFSQLGRVSSKIEDRLNLTNFAKIPFKLIMQVWSYFRAIYDAHKSEAIVLFHFDETTREYTVVVPESYSATAGDVLYDPNQVSFCPSCRVASKNEAGTPCPRGASGNSCSNSSLLPLKVHGTMHSHGSMAAFHSGTDDDHELNQTGFHITMGKVNMPMFELCPSFVVAAFGYRDHGNKGIRFKPSLDALVDFSDFMEAGSDQLRSWMSVAFTPTRLTTIPDSASVVLEKSSQEKSVVVYINSDQSVQDWLSKQPTTRGFKTCTGSELKAMLPPTTLRNGSLCWNHGDTATTPHTTQGTDTTTVRTDTTPTKFLVEKIESPNQTGLTTSGKVTTNGYRKIYVNDTLSVVMVNNHGPMLLNKDGSRVYPWQDITKFSDKEIPKELVDYAMLRITWDLDIGLPKTLDLADLHKSIACFTECVSTEFGTPGVCSTLLNSKETKHQFSFIANHFDRKDPPHSSLVVLAENVVSESYKVTNDPLKRVLVMLAYMSSVLEHGYKAKALLYKEYTRVLKQMKLLEVDVMDAMEEEWSSTKWLNT